MRTDQSAIVTRYPSGYFGLSYKCSTFYFGCLTEKGMRQKIAELGIEKVEWQERYYDRTVPFYEQRCYQTREYFPKQNAEVSQV